MIIVGCLNARTSNSLFTKLQRFFTGKKVTHSFLVLDEYYGDFQLLDARLSVTLDPLNNILNEGNDVWLYSIPLNETESLRIKNLFFNNYIGKTYGFSQLIWFVWRRLLELLFKKDMRAKKNWFSEGILCSEIVYNVLMEISKTKPMLAPYLNKYEVNSFHSGDCKELLDTLVENKVIEKIK